MRTQVCIIGGGPSGLLLSVLLAKSGIDTIVLERRTREYVLGRIRAGVLETGTVDTLREAGIGDRMDKEGIPHLGTILAARKKGFRIPLTDLTGKEMLVYGQTEVTADLYDARDDLGGVIHEVDAVKLHDLTGGSPHVTYFKDGAEQRIDCDFIAGCDGFHGVSRRSVPADILREYERVYPFGWLGILSETPPLTHEVMYANNERGFALCSLRNAALSRYYIQVPVGEPVEKWSDDAFWDEFRTRIPDEYADTLVTGPSVEKSIAPLRSFVAEPMRHGALFLVGDAAHIVPPTGAKGLNLAVGDVRYLFDALMQHYGGDDAGIDGYSDRALARVWHAIRFSWWFTNVMHRFPDQSAFDQMMQDSEIDHLEHSVIAQRALAEQYVGLPF